MGKKKRKRKAEKAALRRTEERLDQIRRARTTVTQGTVTYTYPYSNISDRSLWGPCTCGRHAHG